MTEPVRPPTPPWRGRLPARSLRTATPYLEAPFDAATIGFFARRHRRNAAMARVVFFIPIDEVEARLTLVAGPGGWSRGPSTVIDGRSLSCSLRLLGATHVAIGQGADAGSQSINGLKRCAQHFGVGRYLRSIAPLELPIGTGAGEVPLGADSDPALTPAIAILARAHYARELDRLASHYGPALVHPHRPWHRAGETLRLGRPRGLAAIAARMLESRDEQAAAPMRPVIRTLLRSAPASLIERIEARRAHAAYADAGGVVGPPEARLSVIPGGSQDGGTVAVDFATLGSHPDRRAA